MKSKKKLTVHYKRTLLQPRRECVVWELGYFSLDCLQTLSIWINRIRKKTFCEMTWPENKPALFETLALWWLVARSCWETAYFTGKREICGAWQVFFFTERQNVVTLLIDILTVKFYINPSSKEPRNVYVLPFHCRTRCIISFPARPACFTMPPRPSRLRTYTTTMMHHRVVRAEQRARW